MKHPFALFVLLPFTTQTARAAPAAILTGIQGKVTVARGGKNLPAKNGFALQNGDRVRVQSGQATIFSLGNPPRTVKQGSFAIGAAQGAQTGSSSLWRGVYAGLESGLNRRDRRVAATMRPGEIVLVSPVQTRIETARPRFEWQKAPATRRYEITVTRGVQTLWSAQTESHSCDYPASAPPLGGDLAWQVTPLRLENGVWVPDGGASRAAAFQVAPAAQIAARRADLARLETESRTLSPANRALARAALWNASGFKAAALRELEGTQGETANALRAALWRDTGQFWRFAPPAMVAKTPLGQADPQILAFAPDAPIPISRRKTYLAPDGTFSLQIPTRFTVARMDFPRGVAYSDFAAFGQDGARLGLLSAPPREFAAPDALLEYVRKLLPATPSGQFVTQPRQNLTFRGHKARFCTWTSNRSGAMLRGGWMEWSEAGKKRAFTWNGDAVAGADVLRPLLDTLIFHPAAPRPSVPVSTPVSPDQKLSLAALNALLIKEAGAMNEEMGRAIEQMRLRDFQAPGETQTPTLADFEALDQKRAATPPDTHERAVQARSAARVAAKIAWQAGENGGEGIGNGVKDSALAARLFARRAALETEAYHADSRAIEADLRRSDAMIARWNHLTPSQNVAVNYAIASDAAFILKNIHLSGWWTLALWRGDAAAMERAARALLELRRADLENVQLSGEGRDAMVERRKNVAISFENFGTLAQKKADLHGARAYLVQALKWRRAVAGATRPDIDASLRKRAVLEGELGDIRLARDFYEQTLRELERTAPQREKEIEVEKDAELRELRQLEWVQSRALSLSNLGSVTKNLGDYGLAETHLQKARALLETLPGTGRSGAFRAVILGATLNNLSVLRAEIGDLKGAEGFLRQTAAIYQQTGNDAGLAQVLYAAAGLDYERDDFAGAETKLGAARELFVQLEQPLDLISTDVLLSTLADARGDFERAIGLSSGAVLRARALGNAGWSGEAARKVVAQRLNAAGEAPLSAPVQAELLALLDEATRNDELTGDVPSSIRTRALRSRFLEKTGDAAGALSMIQTAIARLERTRATTSSEAFSEIESHYGLYSSAMRMLLQGDRPEEAFDMLSRARSKKLRDGLQRSALKSNDPVLQKLLDRSAALDEKLARTRAQLAQERALPTPERSSDKLKNLTELIASTQAEFFAVSAQIKAKNPRFDQALSLSPRELKKAQRAIPQGALLLQYAALDDGLYIFAVTRDDLKIYAPKASKTGLQSVVRAYRLAIDADLARVARGEVPSSIDDPKSALRLASAQLSAWLIAPVQSEIGVAKMVAIVPSGELFYLPFHALGAPDAEQKWRFLIEDKPVAYLAAGDVLSIATARDEALTGRGLLGLGDPTGANLPAAKTEVQAIARLFPESSALTGSQASKSAVLLPASREKRILHLAAHGVLNSARPDQSFIQLSPSLTDDGKLRVGEIYGLDLSRVDLVTLSACQTALGEGEPDGSEISSLAQSFSSAGTPSVIASLWNVEDSSTGRLMESFYGGLADGKPKGIALQNAQITLLRAAKTRHPLFWAPFELLGDWR